MGALNFCTVVASTERNPDSVGGKTGAPVTYLRELRIMPLMPVNPEAVQALPLNSPREAKETFCPAGDVKEGDWLVIVSQRYVIKSVAEWPWGAGFLHLVVEELKA